MYTENGGEVTLFINTDDYISIISYKHNRIVFCSFEEYNQRHKSTHFQVVYYDLTKTAKIIERKLKLSTEGEGELWEVNEEGNFSR